MSYRFITRRLITVFSTVTITLLLGACAREQALQPANIMPVPPSSKLITKQLGNINSIEIAGSANVTLKSSNTKRASMIYNQADTYQLTFNTKGHTLRIFANSVTPIHVSVAIKNLKQLTVYGRSNVVSKNLHSSGLSIINHSQNTIALNGMLNINSIKSDNGSITARWVNSDNLSLRATNKAIIHLSGVAHEVTATLHQHGQLQARYLRVNKIRVRTTGYASAEVTPIHSLYAFASNHSNIYYYHQPKHLSRVSKQRANVLAMQ